MSEAGCDAGRQLGAHPLGARGAHHGDERAVDEGGSGLAVGDDELVHVGRHSGGLDGLVEERRAGQRGQRSQLGRLPDHRVAAHERDHRVPGPDRGREVEGGDDGHHSTRVPRLHEAVARSLRRHRAALELARQSDGEVADVDHLLDLAQRLRRDLAHLDRDEHPEVLLVLLQEPAVRLDQGAALRCRHAPPAEEGGMGALDRGLDLLRVRRSDLEEIGAIDGGAGPQAQAAHSRRIDAAGGEGALGQGGQVVGGHARSLPCGGLTADIRSPGW